MGYRTYPIVVKSIATTTQAGAGGNIRVASLIEGTLFVLVSSVAGSGWRLYPSWQSSPNASGATGGRFGTISTFATALKGSTGLSVLPLTGLGDTGRISWVQGATGVRWQAWLLGKGL